MAKRRPRLRVARSSVSLDAADYAHVQDLAQKHRPPLPVRYVIEYAVVRFLDQAREDPKITKEMGTPGGTGDRSAPPGKR